MAQKATASVAVSPQVDYEDERFAQVEGDKQQALTELEQTYGGMISESDRYYQAQIDAAKQWSEKQQQLQQEQTDFAIEQINQQKDQAQKDYTKEQSGAYVDWQKQSDAYGAQAEQLAGAGLKNTGYSESSQVAMYTAYQNRVAVARDAHARAILNYDNAIKDAQLQNNSALAEIAYQALQQELELSLAGFQYKNTLVLEQANKKVELDNTYYSRYMDVLNQINYENEQAEQIRQYEQSFAEQVRQYEQNFAEEVRQYDQTFAENKRQFELGYQLDLDQLQHQKNALAEEIRQFNQSYNLQVKEYNEGVRQFNEEIARLKAKDAQEYKLEIQKLEQQKKALQQEQKQFEAEQKLKKEQLEEEKRQYDKTYELQKQQANKSSGSATVKKSSGSSGGTTTVKNNSTASSNVSFDNDSLIKAGVNPYVTSEAEIARQVANGTLSYKQVGNKLVFSRGSGTTAAQAALNKYTVYTPAKQTIK